MTAQPTLHSLLERQLRHARSTDGELGVQALLNLIDAAYREQDRAIRLADRAMSLASEELNAANDMLRRESEANLEARKAAELASTAKSAFLANMSHELRTPLTAIIGYGEIIQEEAEALGIEQIGKDSGRILASARHLLTLINEVLDLAKVESGKMTASACACNVDALLADLLDSVRPLAARNGNALTLACERPIGAAVIDEVKLRQCLLNLLSNACKFTMELPANSPREA